MNLLPQEKYCMSIDEAAAYAAIGRHKLREIIENNPDLDFILYKGKQIIIKRPQFEEWIASVTYI